PGASRGDCKLRTGGSQPHHKQLGGYWAAHDVAVADEEERARGRAPAKLCAGRAEADGSQGSKAQGGHGDPPRPSSAIATDPSRELGGRRLQKRPEAWLGRVRWRRGRVAALAHSGRTTTSRLVGSQVLSSRDRSSLTTA